MSFVYHDPALIVEEKDAVGVITLNRAEALNALSYGMIRACAAILAHWATDARIRAVFIQGAGERAFCAGGDIKAAYMLGQAYKAGQVPEPDLSAYFAEEYRLNRQLKHYPKPIVAFMDGITMGGGFGIAGPCMIRVVTDRTLFAMPEVGIGLFPDVGSMWFLNRCPGEAGTYLALTGQSLGPADTVHCGLGTHYVPDMSGPDLIAAMNEALASAAVDTDGTHDALSERFGGLQKNTGARGDIIESHRAAIDEAFAGDHVEDILTRLSAQSPWGAGIRTLIETRSPVSVKVSLAHLRQARGQDFDTISARDLVLAHNFMKGHDFFEGVRAMVIDKDRKPVWAPGHLHEVDDALVAAHFTPPDFLKKGEVHPVLSEISPS